MRIQRILALVVVLTALPVSVAVAQSRSELPMHKMVSSSQPGRAKAQIRAVVKSYPNTEREWKQLAVDLATAHPAAGSYLVQFFSDESCLTGWAGNGLLRDSDWPHWLGRATVETNAAGQLYGNSFKVAVDAETGLDRTGILR